MEREFRCEIDEESFQLTIFSQNEMIQTRFRSDEHASSHQ